MRRIGVADPYVLVGGPPCTGWIAFTVKLSHRRLDAEVVIERRRKACAHFECATQLRIQQLDRGGNFLR